MNTNNNRLDGLSRGTFNKYVLRSLAFGLALGASLPAASQQPSLGVTGLPAMPLINESFCVDLAFTNTGGATGYGPYVVAVGGPFLTVNSVTFVDVSPDLEKIGDFGPSGTLLNPITEEEITGPEGGAAWIARYPLGSVAPGAPPSVLTACAVVDVGAVPNEDIPVSFAPGFEFGDTPTGENGPLEEPPQADVVTPVVARVEKTNTAPEGERPPGQSFPFNYVWSINISDGEMIENVLLEDNLPGEVQWTGAPVVIDAPNGNNCAVTGDDYDAPGPGGRVVVECDSVVGTQAEQDIQVRVPVYIVDVLNQGSSANLSIENRVDFSYDNRGDNYSTFDVSVVVAKHFAVQKTVSGTVRPGSVLTYTIDFQVTNFTGTPPGITELILLDLLPDGLRYQDTQSLLINGVNTPVTPLVNGPQPGTGLTGIAWDVLDAAGGSLPSGVRGSLEFTTRVQSDYIDGSPVQASDDLNNAAGGTYALSEGADGGDTTNAPSVNIPNDTDKTMVSPSPAPDFLMPGETVVFRLHMSVPSGSTSQVRFVDALPGPVFDVTGFDVLNDWSIPPGVNHTPLQVTKDNTANTITIDWGDISTTLPEVLEIDLELTVSDEPFADRLFLTNLFLSEYENSDGEVIQNTDALGINVGAPELALTKGVLSADNPRAEFDVLPPSDPSLELADSNVRGVDGSDLLTYLITVENVGTQSAYEVTVSDPDIPGLSCAEPTAAQVVNGSGAQLAFSGSIQTGLVLTAPLPGNDGTIGAPYSDDTLLLSLSCTLSGDVVFGSSLTNVASASWKPTPDAVDAFPAEDDEAIATIDIPEITKAVVAINPGVELTGAVDPLDTNPVVIGEIASYRVQIRLPEGVSPDSQLEDRLDNGLAFEGLFAAPPAATPPIAITPSAGVSTDIVGGFDAIAQQNFQFYTLGNSPDGDFRRILYGPNNNNFGFGTVANSNASNGSDEYITLDYMVRVLNSSGNNKGKALNNQVTWGWLPQADLERQEVQGSARELVIEEPRMKVNKRFNPSVGDQDTVSDVTITVQHNGNKSNAIAYDLTMDDVLPERMRIVGGEGGVQVTCTGATAAPQPMVLSGPSGDILEADWPVFYLGDSCTFEFQVQFDDTVFAGEDFDNCADVRWTSLPGDAPALGPLNSLGYERTGTTADPGGSANDYAVLGCDTFSIRDVGVEKTVIATDQAHTDGLPAPDETEPLTIGEEVTFQIITTLPESAVTQLTIKDLMPASDVILRADSAAVSFVGDQIILNPPTPPSAVLSDVSDDGINDTVQFDFGDTITHLIDGDTNTEDTIVVDVVATVVDVPANQDGDLGVNTAQAIYGPDVTDNPTLVTDQWRVTIVEPSLDVTKTGSTTSIAAGDPVTYTLRMEHLPSSEADAFQVVLSDVIPPDLAYLPGSLSTGAVCTDTPETLEILAGEEIVAEWEQFVLGAVCEIQFSVVAELSAISGSSIVNTGDIQWTSLDTTGDPDDRPYEADSSWTIVVSEPGIDKRVVDTSVEETVFFADQSNHQVTIGELITFEITASFTDGTTEDVWIEDVLPTNGVALEFVSGEILFIGADLETEPGVVVGMPFGDCEIASPDCRGWELGRVVDLIDYRPDPDIEDQMIFRIVAIVLNDPLNSGVVGSDKDLNNSGIGRSSNDQIVDIAPFDLIEPVLSVRKVTDTGASFKEGVAGELETFVINIAHTDASTAPALDILVTDPLDANMEWVEGSEDSDCNGFALQSAPDDGESGILEFFVPQLDVSEGECFISFEARIANDAGNPGIYPNVAEIEWNSAPGSPQNRVGNADSEAFIFLRNSIELLKRISSTSMDDTGTAAFDPDDPPGYPGDEVDGSIGEVIEFEVTLAFDNGLTENVLVTDTLDPGWTFLNADIVFKGENITTEFVGLPTGVGNSFSADFGDVLNSPNDGVRDREDTIVIRVLARVADIPENEQDDYLENEASASFDGGPDVSDFDVIDVVEPVLQLDKSFDDLTAAVATVTLMAENTGSGPAYRLQLSDEFDEAYWVPESMVPVTEPTGYQLDQSYDVGTGITTVTLSKVPLNQPQPGPILPGESLSASFTMTLQNGGDVGVAVVPNVSDGVFDSTPLPNDDTRESADTGEDDLLFPVLDLTKTWSGPSNPATPGDVLTYTLELANTGAAPATNVVISDTPDDVGEFRAGSVTTSMGTVSVGNNPGNTSIEVIVPALPEGESVTVSYLVQVPTPYPDGFTDPEELVNQARAESTELAPVISDDDPSTPDVDDPLIVPIVADPVMTIDKDDQVGMTSPGALLEYSLRVENTGNQDATGVVVTEQVPQYARFVAAASSPGWDCADGSAYPVICQLPVGPLAGQSGIDLIFAVRVDSTVPSGVDMLDNTVEVTDDGKEYDDDAPVVPSVDSDNELTPLVATPLLTLTKDDGGIFVTPGQAYAYTLVYGNAGNQDTTGVVLTETVPEYTTFNASRSTGDWDCAANTAGSICTIAIGPLAAGDAFAVDFGLTVDYPAYAGVDLIVNSALLQDGGPNALESVPAADSTPLIAAPDLVIEKSTEAGVVREGDEVIYSIEYSNVGNQDATGVVIEETVPEGAEFLAAESDPDWSCSDGSPAGTTCLLPIGDLAVGAGGEVVFAITLVETPEDRTLRNTVEVEDDGFNGGDLNPEDNVDTVINAYQPLTIPVMARNWLILMAIALFLLAVWQRRKAAA